MTDIELRQRFSWIDSARVLAAVAVVFVHVSAYFMELDLLRSNDLGNAAVFYNAFSRFCVPLFVVISGFLLSGVSAQASSVSSSYFRVKRIAIPLVFWSSFFIAWSFMKAVINANDFSWFHFAELVIKGKPYSHLWYMYMLLGLYMILPVLQHANAALDRSSIKALILLFFIISMFNYGYRVYYDIERGFFLSWCFDYIPYFLIGSFLRQYAIKVKSSTLFFIFIASGLSAFLLVVDLYDNLGGNAFYFIGYFSPLVVLMTVSIALIFKSHASFESKTVSRLSASTFGIYLVHPVFIDLVKYLHLIPKEFSQWASVPLLSLFVFTMSYVFYVCISRIPYLKRVV